MADGGKGKITTKAGKCMPRGFTFGPGWRQWEECVQGKEAGNARILGGTRASVPTSLAKLIGGMRWQLGKD